MSFVEPMESRRLCAATPDVTFADGGHLSFSGDYSVRGVLATYGEIYVQAYQRHRSRTVLFKYNDSGDLDTTWGRGGYVVPQRFADLASTQTLDIVTMVRDNRTGG